MKRKLLLCAGAIAVLSACKKEETPGPASGETFPVSFKVTNLKQTVEDYPPTTKAAPKTEDEFINHLWYFVYRSDGKLDWYRYQDQWPITEIDHFGDVHLELPKGDFRLVVVGARDHLTFPDSAMYSTAHFEHTAWWNPGDVFYKEVQFSVTGAEIIQDVKIDRISAMLEFNLLETPTDVRLSLALKYRTVLSYPFDKNGDYEFEWLDLTRIKGEFIPWTQNNLVYRSIVIPNRSDKFDTETILQIHGPRMNGDEFVLKGVYVYPNKKTVVTGSLLNGQVYQNFYVDVDSAYSDTTYIDTGDLEFY